MAADAAAAAACSAFADAEAILGGASDRPDNAAAEGGQRGSPDALRVGLADLNSALAALKQRTATDVRLMRMYFFSLWSRPVVLQIPGIRAQGAGIRQAKGFLYTSLSLGGHRA